MRSQCSFNISLRNMIRTVSNLKYFCKRFQCTSIPLEKLNEEAKLFLASYPKVIDAVTTHNIGRNLPKFINRYKQLIEYTVFKERRFRPSMFIDAYKALESPRNFSKEKWDLVIMFAWSLELTQAAMIVQDDTWDQQLMRWNEVCWHKKPNVGLIAINDGVLLYEAAFAIVKEYFFELPEYISLIEVLHYMNFVTAIGQSLDWECRRNGKPVYECFNMDSFRTIGCRKGGGAIVDGPFMGALVLSGNVHMLKYVWDILLELGVAFQIDNDILDLYDKEGNVRNPIGSDICDGKPTWMAINVLEGGNQDVINVFKQNYGRSEIECQHIIINIYDEFKMFHKYLEHRLKTTKLLEDRTSKMPLPLRNAVFSITKNIIPTLDDRQ